MSLADQSRPDPVITVVTVALNDLAGIKRTFESLAEQVFRDVQHIVIDGGSTDGTAEWARDNTLFSKTVVVSEPDTGIYDAMNKGLSLTEGDLVSFLNSGDRYADGSVLAMVAESYVSEDWPWAYGYGRIVNENGERSARGRVRKRPSWLRNTFWDYEICHSAVFMPPGLMRELGGFDERFRIAADYKLTTSAWLVAQPHVFRCVMADQVEGGVSDAQPGSSLLETHRVRVELLRMGPAASALDWAWTMGLIARSKFRRKMGRWLRRIRSRIDARLGSPQRAIRTHE
jgi:hypothetical protein